MKYVLLLVSFARVPSNLSACRRPHSYPWWGSWFASVLWLCCSPLYHVFDFFDEVNLHLMSYFSVAMIKYSDKITLGRGGLFWYTVQEQDPLWRGGWSGWSHYIHSHSGTLTFPSCTDSHPAQGMRPLTVDGSFYLINLIKIYHPQAYLGGPPFSTSRLFTWTWD